MPVPSLILSDMSIVSVDVNGRIHRFGFPALMVIVCCGHVAVPDDDGFIM